MSFRNPLNFIKKANRSFNVYLENYKRINGFLNAYGNNQKKIEDFLAVYRENQKTTDEFLAVYRENQKKTEEFMERYGRNQEKNEALLSVLLDVYGENQEKIDRFQEKTNDFVDSIVSIKGDLKKASDRFNNNYDSCKEYFFNGDEHLFKMRDTDKFFQMCFFNGIKLLSYSIPENRFYLETGDGIKLVTNNRFYTIEEIFARDGYSLPQLDQFKEFVVFDIGMNRGYASLKFANYDSCKAVYGFEIDNDTYNFAIENFNLNPELSHKIKPHRFGLSNENTHVDLYTLPGYDGVTTTELEFTNVQAEWLREKENMKIKKGKVKEAGSVISDIIENNKIKSNIVLKIDTEGSEVKIIDNLISKGVLDKVDLVMGEGHLESENLESKFSGFKDISKFHKPSTIHNFYYVRKQFYHALPLAR